MFSLFDSSKEIKGFASYLGRLTVVSLYLIILNQFKWCFQQVNMPINSVHNWQFYENSMNETTATLATPTTIGTLTLPTQWGYGAKTRMQMLAKCKHVKR